MAFTKTPADPNDRFDEKVKVDDSGCWLWTGHIDHKGYGVFGVTSKQLWKAHRYSYARHVGPIPEGMQLDHLCRVRHCVNPKHLEPVTNQENTVRGNAAREKATHCKRGHAFEGNAYMNPKGRRECRTCRSDAVLRYQQRARK
ncbi:HNH endonuclease signature motif containing protein [Ectopseudomonas oleovorans]|uniref:HNH endonuclease signature motif containing protein n=1 Tax=Ectopseudomonas oleovorans TaxID=301 RepID=UPI000A04F8D0|nr:HNH endonuclease signature motif containing protein [Pseudomonas oleovorans]